MNEMFAEFGRWEERKANVAYQANSDGFIAAYTGGESPASEFTVCVGEQVDDLPVRTIAGRYDGTVCPVPKGDYWIVAPAMGEESQCIGSRYGVVY